MIEERDRTEDAAAGRRLRLPPAARLRSSREFRQVWREGVRARGRLILVVAAPSSHPGAPRIGLSVGRKFSRKAVLRNRARRALREAFRTLRPDLPAWDFILLPLRPAPMPEVRDELVKLLPRLEARMRPPEDPPCASSC